jgi:hypothetical protein
MLNIIFEIIHLKTTIITLQMKNLKFKNEGELGMVEHTYNPST